MHGRPRATQSFDPARQKQEEDKIAKFQSLLHEVLQNHRERNFSKQALLQNGRLLENNPEVYTAWNYRKLAVIHSLESEPDEGARKSILDEELSVVERALMRNFKSYGAWHHRKWVLNFGLSSLEHEYRLLDRLLTSDARNFHGWAYRRFLAKVSKATEVQELEYTMKKINENFSNYSAWHYRSALLSKQLLGNAIQKDTCLAEEYTLITTAFFTEPEDQSGCFYLMWLLSQTVLPSGPSLVGFWPLNGSSVLWDVGGPSKRSSWSYRLPWSNSVYLDCSFPCLILCFDKPVLGVDATTILVQSLPEAACEGLTLLWTPVNEDVGGSRVWRADLEGLNKNLQGGGHYTLHVDVGTCPGIHSKDGPLLCANRVSFTIETRSSDVAIHKACDASVAWPAKQSPLKCEKVMQQASIELYEGSARDREPSPWQMKILEDQIDSCRELLDLERDSKWAMLNLARLLMAHDELAGSLHRQKPHMNEVQQLYQVLTEVDPIHKEYYNEQLSLLTFDQVTCSLHNLCERWLECHNLTANDPERWLRFDGLSLSRIGYYERLIWVQRLDLSNNNLHSLEGIEMMQLLVNLDVSRNQLPTITALWPIRLLPHLEALNIEYNHIGIHTIDTNRYQFSSALNNSVEGGPSKAQDCPNGTTHWDVRELFGGLPLRQLDMRGNPVADDPLARRQVCQALPFLVWLDGERVCCS